MKVGQKVRLTVDAFPEKKYTGVVTSVANIGEQLPNTDAKVFEVIIKVDGSDPILRPSMTTGNQIITQTFNDVLYTPLETVFATADSIPTVFTKNGTREVVMLGVSNENDVIVEQGVEEGEKLLLSMPENVEKYKMAGEDLIASIKEQKAEQARQEEEARQRAGSQQQPAGANPGNMTPEQMRDYFQNLSPEEREAMRQQRGAAGGQGMGQGRPQGTGEGMPGGARPDSASAQGFSRQQ